VFHPDAGSSVDEPRASESTSSTIVIQYLGRGKRDLGRRPGAGNGSRGGGRLGARGVAGWSAEIS
jgi:hypothetical protein